MKKRGLSLLLVLCMVLSLGPVLAAPAVAAESYLWPVDGIYTMSRGYTSGHGGIDIISSNILGAPIRASKSGTVVYRADNCPHTNYVDNFSDCCGGTGGCNGGAGNYIMVRNDDGTYCRYLHMQQGTSVANGTHLKQGDFVGRVGSSGQSTAPHLHFEIMSGSNYQTDKVNCNPTDSRHSYYYGSYTPAVSYIYSVEDDKPNPKTDSALYAPGSNVTVHWNTVKNAYYYYVIINKDGKNIFNRSVGGDLSYTISNAEAGSYEFFVQSYDRNGNGSGNVGCFFDVGYVGIPHPKTDKAVYTPGSKVTVSWDAVANAYYYYVIINKDGQNIFNRSVGGDLSYTFDSAESGSYEFFVQAYDKQGHGSGNIKCTFEVEYVGRPNLSRATW